MRTSFLVLASLLVFSLAQIIITPNLTLVDAIENNSTTDYKLLRAFAYILATHPELENDTIANVNEVVNSNKTLTDFFITLRGSNTTLLVAVSISSNLSTFFVSYSKIGPNSLQNITTPIPNPSLPSINNSSQISQAILAPQNASITALKAPHPPNLLGGFHILDNLNDPRLRTALNYLQEIHSNMINYQILIAEYQIVSGINFLIHFSGLDELTMVSAKVNINLSGLPTLLAFNVSCAAPQSFECNLDIANEIYYGTEFLLGHHVELQSYKLISIIIEEHVSEYTTFMATFQNDHLKLRALAEIIINSKTATILSFYSYGYL